MIITMDGAAGTGKGTAARHLAEQMGFLYVDTGAMYRAFAYWCLKQKTDIEDEAALEEALASFSYRIEDHPHSKHYFVGNEEVTQQIRIPEVSQLASQISTVKRVREEMVAKQRELGMQGGTVFEGRDTGTVVFPEADIKVFLIARPQVRARRRFLELTSRGIKTNEEEVLQEQQQRDERDATRQYSPLRPAEDAYVIDTSELTPEEVVERIVRFINGRGNL